MTITKKEPNNKRTYATIAMFLFLGLTLLVNPDSATAVMFKVCLATFAVFMAYIADKLLQPQVDMSQLAELIKDGDDNDKARAVELAKAAMIRRAIITLALVIGICLGM